MVSSINEFSPLNPARPGVPTSADADLTDKAAEARRKDARQPAARIGLSDTAQAVKEASAQAVGDNFDAQLVREIRDRIAQGTFEIDYQKIAAGTLRDALAAARDRGR